MVISMLVLGFLTLSFILIGAASLGNELQVNLVLENKVLSAAAATGCMEQAIDRLGRNAAYAGNETLTVASSTCMVRPVIIGGGIWTLETWAQNLNQYTRYRAVLTSRSPVIIGSWTEVAGF
jgi:hypothetical protein